MKCVECEEPKAKYKCRDCGEYYCQNCMDDRQAVCPCKGANIFPIKTKDKSKNKS